MCFAPCAQHAGTNNFSHNIPIRNEENKKDWVTLKMNGPCTFWTNNTKHVQRKKNPASFDEALQMSQGVKG